MFMMWEVLWCEKCDWPRSGFSSHSKRVPLPSNVVTFVWHNYLFRTATLNNFIIYIVGAVCRLLLSLKSHFCFVVIHLNLWVWMNDFLPQLNNFDLISFLITTIELMHRLVVTTVVIIIISHQSKRKSRWTGNSIELASEAHTHSRLQASVKD